MAYYESLWKEIYNYLGAYKVYWEVILETAAPLILSCRAVGGDREEEILFSLRRFHRPIDHHGHTDATSI